MGNPAPASLIPILCSSRAFTDKVKEREAASCVRCTDLRYSTLAQTGRNLFRFVTGEVIVFCTVMRYASAGR